MVSFWRGVLFALVGVSLAGCAGLTQIEDTITKYDQGAHSVSAAEMNFFKSVQTVDCTSQFYLQAIGWANGTEHNFYINGICTPTILTDDQIKTRQALMDAITLYADKMAALASRDDSKTLDTNSQKLASNINNMAKQHQFSALPVAADVEAAIIGISDMVLDQKKFAEIKKAARDMQPDLQTVVMTLQKENIIFAQGIASKIDRIEAALRPLVAAEKQRGMVSFLDLLEARRILQSANPFSTTSLAADPDKDPQNVALQLNKALDAVLNANKAIASAGTGGIIASVNDLIARAQAAQSIQTALNK
ncbi:MAG: hypothetical protein ABSH41_04045 [Syntrophobacteraceae bacterium]